MAFDADNDGKLSKDEITDTRLTPLLQRADANNDGIVTKEELKAQLEKEAAVAQRSERGPGGPGGGGPGGFAGRDGNPPPPPGDRGGPVVREAIAARAVPAIEVPERGSGWTGRSGAGPADVPAG